MYPKQLTHTMRPIIAIVLFGCSLFYSPIVQGQSMDDNRYYIYSEGFEAGTPSGFMGSNGGVSIKMIENYDKGAMAGNKCIRVTSSGSEEWAGVYLLYTGRWRSQLKDAKYLNLSGYTQFVFYARADKPMFVDIGLGEGGEDNISEKNLELSTKWTKYSLDISDLNLSQLNGLFFFNVSTPGSFYFDEIYLEKKKTKGMDTQAKPEPKPYATTPGAIKTEVKQIDGSWTLIRDGKPYYIKGAGGHSFMDRVVMYGGNSIRTWSDENARQILDSAHSKGLSVMFGLWVQHERHGYNYDDKESVYFQLQRFKDVVIRFKDHPALLLWGIGNEVDLFYKNTNVWYAVQDIAKMVHEVDPNHPTCTVTAGFDPEECRLIMERCPDIDIYGVNTYGGLEFVPKQITDAGWKGPYIISEWGPNGHWEVAKTEFNSPVEQTSTEKAASYKARYEVLQANKDRCIGSYVFQWGNKQETTPTWYGVFLPDGQETEVIDVLNYGWSGKWPENRSPSVQNLLIEGKKALDNIYLAPEKEYKATVEITDPDQDTIKYRWEIMPESTDIKTGGDFETTPEPMPELLKENKGSTLVFATPAQSGAYRLFIYAYDGKGNAAVANTLFFVK